MHSAHEHDPHVSHIEHLADWTGLVRYWIGHDYSPALKKAVGLLKSRGTGSRHWQHLADYLEGVFSDPHGRHPAAPSPSDLARLSEIERYTLLLVDLVPPVVGCEQAPQALANWPEQMVVDILRHVGTACQLAAEIGDLPIEGRCCRALAQGLEVLESFQSGPISSGPLALEFRLRTTAEARQRYLRAQVCYEQLFAQRPEVYRLALVLTLAGHSSFCYRHGDGTGAGQTFARAVELFATLGQVGRESDGRALVGTWVNLALAQQMTGEPGAARTSLELSLQLCRSLAVSDPTVFRPFLAQVLDRLAALLRDTGARVPACDLFREAVAVYHSLPEDQTQGSRPERNREISLLFATLCAT